MNIIDEDNLCDNAAKMGDYLQQRLVELSEKYSIISNVRGKGLLTAFDFPDTTTRNKLISKGMEQNVMFLGCGEQSIRFRPALIIEQNHIDQGLEILEKICAAL
jgi:L-lysine 6-transaminase